MRSQSRYESDFREISLIGQGGFGSVYRVENLLDGGLYALKKIHFISLTPHSPLYEKVLKEVRSLASLDHPNIIRYYQSWVEHDMIDVTTLDREGRSSLDTPMDDESYTETSIDSSITAITYTDYNFTCDSDASDVEIERQFAENVNNVPLSLTKKNGSSDSPRRSSFSSLSQDDSMIPTTETTIPSAIAPPHSMEPEPSSPHDSFLASYYEESTSTRYRRDRVLVDRRQRYSITADSSPVCKITLYIQMQLCQNTLETYLSQRNRTVNAEYNLHIFRQLVSGVAYVHARKLVHRDLKPSNIFLQEATPPGIGVTQEKDDLTHLSVVKIGDFGTSVRLASLEAEAVAKSSMESLPSMLATEGSDTESTMSMSSVQSDMVGTSLYASPEQCSSGSSHKTTDRSDIYSLGIILFELYWPVKSADERTVLINKLRAGNLPRKMFRLYPKEAASVLWLVSDAPEDRPSAIELLDSEFLKPPAVISISQNELAEYAKRIQAQENLLRRQETIIKEQEKKINQLAKAVKGSKRPDSPSSNSGSGSGSGSSASSSTSSSKPKRDKNKTKSRRSDANATL